MYNVIIQTWFFLTPIVYEPSIVPFRYRVWLSLNPMYHLVQVFRKPVYDGVIPAVPLLAGSLGLSVAVLVTGWVFFCHRSDNMAYWS
jgi:ABC-type polysaccharide/polyol phosphate export permease